MGVAEKACDNFDSKLKESLNRVKHSRQRLKRILSKLKPPANTFSAGIYNSNDFRAIKNEESPNSPWSLSHRVIVVITATLASKTFKWKSEN